MNLPLASRHCVLAVVAAGVATLAAADAVAELDEDEEAAGHLMNLCVFGSLHWLALAACDRAGAPRRKVAARIALRILVFMGFPFVRWA